MGFQIPTWTTKWLEPSGLISRPWYQYLTQLQQTVGGTLAVGSGGTGLASGTDGGVLGFTGTTTLKSSVLLKANAIVLGGGAGATPTALGTLGTTSQVLHGNAAGAPSFSQVATGDVSANAITNALLAQMATLTIKGNNTGGTANALDLTATQTLALLGIGSAISGSLGADVAMNVQNQYFDGPSIAQGSVGTWIAFGGITIIDSGGGTTYNIKLWDGTNVKDSRACNTDAAGREVTAFLAGIFPAPPGNIRISALDTGFATGKMVFNASGNSKDCTVSAFRIA